MIEVHQDADDAIRADFLCKQIGNTLRRHYPKREWYVEVSIKGGVAKIMCPSISQLYGYVLHLDKSTEGMERAVMRAGGQILEMFNLSRAVGAEGGEDRLARDLRGEALHAQGGL